MAAREAIRARRCAWRSPSRSIAAGCQLHLRPAPPRRPGRVVAGALVRRQPRSPRCTRVEDREPVALDAMAPSLPKAVVAIEDERFFDHDGVDARGVVRALTRDVQAGQPDRGRLDDHPAVRPRGDARPGEGPRAQAPRGGDGGPARAPLLEAHDPRALPEHHLLRQRRLRRAGRGPPLLRPGRRATSTSPRAALLAGRHPGARDLQPVHRAGAARWPAATRCSTGSAHLGRAAGGRGRARPGRSRSGSRRRPTDSRYPAPYFVEQVTQAHPGATRRSASTTRPAPPAAARGRPAHPHDARPAACRAWPSRPRPG